MSAQFQAGGYTEAFQAYLEGGMKALTPEQKAILRDSHDPRQQLHMKVNELQVGESGYVMQHCIVTENNRIYVNIGFSVSERPRDCDVFVTLTANGYTAIMTSEQAADIGVNGDLIAPLRPVIILSGNPMDHEAALPTRDEADRRHHQAHLDRTAQKV